MPNLDIKIINLSKKTDKRGHLIVAEMHDGMPFDIKRSYWLYGVPKGVVRGEHAHRCLQEMLVAVNGSFCVTLDNGYQCQKVTLHQPHQALLIEPGIWHSLSDFSAHAVCLVLASEHYDANDYIKDYDEFLSYVKCTR